MRRRAHDPQHLCGQRPTGLTLVLAAAIALGACRGLPEESYGWHPSLAATRGKLESFVATLPLGAPAGLQHQHPLDRADDTVVISNIRDLSPFVGRQEGVVASALAWYRPTESQANAFAYAALLAAGAKPSLAKEDEYSGNPSWMKLGGAQTHVTFFVRPVPDLLPAESGCRLYAADASVDVVGGGIESAAASMMLSESMDYVVLVGASRNLYIELAVPAEVFGVPETYEYPPKRPLKPLAWNREPLATLRRAHEAMGLGVCKLPSPGPQAGR